MASELVHGPGRSYTCSLHKKVLTEVKSDRDNYSDTVPHTAGLLLSQEQRETDRDTLPSTLPVSHQWI